MHLGARRSPHQAQLVERFVDVGEGRWRKVVVVIGEHSSGELVARKRRHTQLPKGLRCRPQSLPQHGEGSAGTGINVGGEHGADSGPDRRPDDHPGVEQTGAHLLGDDDAGHSGSLLRHPLDPGRHDRLECVSQLPRDRDEAGLVDREVGSARGVTHLAIMTVPPVGLVAPDSDHHYFLDRITLSAAYKPPITGWE